jgi:hypothetical protein
MDIENKKALIQRLNFPLSFLKIPEKRYTTIAPADIPNMAIDIAMKAKWYHMVTLKIRVRRTSYINVESVTIKRPIYVRFPALTSARIFLSSFPVAIVDFVYGDSRTGVG